MAYAYRGGSEPEPKMKSPKAKSSQKSKKSSPKVASKAGKMPDKQQADLKKHMDGLGLKGKQRLAHRRMMVRRMGKGMSIAQAHKDIMM